MRFPQAFVDAKHRGEKKKNNTELKKTPEALSSPFSVHGLNVLILEH